MRSTEQPLAASLSGEELLRLAQALRRRFFALTLLVAVLLVPVAGLLIFLTGEHLILRTSLLFFLGTGAAVCAFYYERCYELLAAKHWLILILGFVGAFVLIAGDAHQNATFIVLTAMLGAAPIAAGLPASLAAGLVTVLGYIIGMAIRGEPLLINGRTGDIDAMASMLVGIYGAFWIAGQITETVADANLDAQMAAELTASEHDGGHHGEQPVPGRQERVQLAQLMVTAAEGDDAATAKPRLAQRGLTPRECEVALLAADGLGQQRIADQLGISPNTAGKHLESIRKKLGISGQRNALPATVINLLKLPQPPDTG